MFERTQGQKTAEKEYRLVQFPPHATGGCEQAQFVGGEEDEIVVRIRSEASARRCRAEASERFQSSFVIVLKSGVFERIEDEGPMDPG